METRVTLVFWRPSGVLILNFEHISHLALVFLLLTLGRKMPAESFIFAYFRKLRSGPVSKISENKMILEI